ncbi:hypothetical protein ElyMa_003406900 [Elysia marginata]|uniref:IgGFc-binding protein N-terminal domain-containing protein n=1 Tax=Elysia marginata TaxID=1093978 RepID=A0AAV4JMU9_9GAST|nr:hypothetical protein ElyMa_003406900 [Elysia marginata]
MEELETKLEQVEERLERQEDFADDVHQALGPVLQNIGSSSSRGPQSSANLTVATPAVPTPTTPIVLSDFVATLIDVRRERIETGYRFTVRYIPHAQDLRVAYVSDSVVSNHDYYNYLQELTGVPESGNVLSVTIEKGFAPYEYDPTYIYFMTETESVGVKVFTAPGSAGNLYTRVEVWPLTVSAEEVVYVPGEDTELLDIRYTNSTSSLDLEIVMVNLSSGEALIRNRLQHSSLFDTILTTAYGPGREKTIQGRIKTSRYRYRISGYVNVIARTYMYSNSSALDVLEVKKKIVLRPSNQAGPFPDGYLGFATVQGAMITQDGTTLYVCNVTNGGPCKEIVFILSERDLNLTCQELKNNGQRHPLPVTPPSDLEFNEDVKKYLFTVEPANRYQNSSKVQCTAVNATGFQVTKQAEVLYFEQPRILVHRSSVQNNHSNVRVVCAASGHPLPLLQVSVRLESSEHDYSSYLQYEISAEDTVTLPGGREVQGFVTFPLDSTKSLGSVHCGANTIHSYRREGGYLDTIYMAYTMESIFEA